MTENNITFNCPKCDQHLEAPASMGGTQIECPSCAQPITIPASKRKIEVSKSELRRHLREQASHSIETRSKAKSHEPGRADRNFWPIRGLMLRPKVVVALLVVAVTVGYVAWPYLALRRFYNALQVGDADAISEAIDFPSFRESMKDELNVMMLREMDTDEMADNPFAGLAMVALPALVQQMVDSYITPSGITEFFSSEAFEVGVASVESESSASESDSREMFGGIESASFDNPTSFSVSTRGGRLTFKLRDWGWKLSEIRLTREGLRQLQPETDVQQAIPIADSGVIEQQIVTPPEATRDPSYGMWYVSATNSIFDDSPLHVLALESTKEVGAGFSSYRPVLTVRYQEGSLDILISYGTYLGSDAIPVLTRLDYKEAVEREWHPSTDGRAVFYPDITKVFLDRLMAHEKLAVRLTPFSENPVTCTFDLRGLDYAANDMLIELEGK